MILIIINNPQFYSEYVYEDDEVIQAWDAYQDILDEPSEMDVEWIYLPGVQTERYFTEEHMLRKQKYRK